MSESTVLAREETERGELVLRRRLDAVDGTVYEIIFNGCFLMSSTNAVSARALAELGLAPLAGRSGLHVLVGGLGLGYTLQAALEQPGVARVEVVEVEPLIAEWGRVHFGPLTGNALDDSRVQVVLSDLADRIASTADSYDAILLDIDNGPTWTVFEENAAVYDRPALERMRALLNPGGVLAVWASEPAPDFLALTRQIWGRADEVVVSELVDGRQTDYFIYRAGPL